MLHLEPSGNLIYFFPTLFVKTKELLYFVGIRLCYNSSQTSPSLLFYWMSWSFPTFTYSTYLPKHAFSILHAVFKVWPIGLAFPPVCFHKLIDSPVQILIFQQNLPFSNHCHRQSTIHRGNCPSTAQQMSRPFCQKISWKFKHLATFKPLFLIWHHLLLSELKKKHIARIHWNSSHWYFHIIPDARKRGMNKKHSKLPQFHL